MRKYLYLILLSFFVFLGPVKAVSSAPNGIQTTTSTSSYEPGIKKLPIKIYNDTYPNWDVSQFLEIYSYEEYPYIIVEFCSYYDTSYYVSSSYSTANFYNYGGTIQYSQNIGKCSITGVNGTFTKRRAVIQVSSWGDPHGGAEALSTRGTIQFRNQGEYSQYIEIQNIYLTDSNQFSPNLDSTNEKIDETNSKLDEAQETRKGIWESIKGIGSSILNLPNLIWNAIKGGFEAITGAISNMFDFFKDDEGPDMAGLENSAGWLPAGPVDSIVNLPLSLLNNLSTNLGKTCQPVVLPLPYVNKNLTLPCINSIYEQMGSLSSWINTIGVIASAFILFYYFIKLYAWVDKTLTMRENNYMDNWGGI